jgi:hypothetical protein
VTVDLCTDSGARSGRTLSYCIAPSEALRTQSTLARIKAGPLQNGQSVRGATRDVGSWFQALSWWRSVRALGECEASFLRNERTASRPEQAEKRTASTSCVKVLLVVEADRFEERELKSATISWRESSAYISAKAKYATRSATTSARPRRIAGGS